MGAKVSSANPYLRDRGVRERTVLRSVATSSAIEGIRTGFKRKTKGARARGSTHKSRSYPVTFVNRGCAAIAGYKFRSVRGGSRSYKSVIRGTADDLVIWQPQDELSVRGRIQPEKGVGKAS